MPSQKHTRLDWILLKFCTVHISQQSLWYHIATFGSLWQTNWLLYFRHNYTDVSGSSRGQRNDLFKTQQGVRLRFRPHLSNANGEWTTHNFPAAHPTLTATEFFISATAEVNSLKWSSGQYTRGWARSPLLRPALTQAISHTSVLHSTAAWCFPVQIPCRESRNYNYTILSFSDKLGTLTLLLSKGTVYHHHRWPQILVMCTYVCAHSLREYTGQPVQDWVI